MYDLRRACREWLLQGLCVPWLLRSPTALCTVGGCDARNMDSVPHWVLAGSAGGSTVMGGTRSGLKVSYNCWVRRLPRFGKKSVMIESFEEDRISGSFSAVDYGSVIHVD